MVQYCSGVPNIDIFVVFLLTIMTFFKKKKKKISVFN